MFSLSLSLDWQEKTSNIQLFIGADYETHAINTRKKIYYLFHPSFRDRSFEQREGNTAHSLE